MVTTSANMRYNETDTQPDRTSIFCEKTRKLMMRIDTASLAQLANVSGGQWCWCRGCHAEHYILWTEIAQMKNESTRCQKSISQ